MAAAVSDAGAPAGPAPRRLNVLMCGTGEYTTGYVHGSLSPSDKRYGVVALVLMDLRRRGRVQWLGLCGRQGHKMPAVREHLVKSVAGSYRGLDATVDTFPADTVPTDETAYKAAIDRCQPGDAITIFTPDDTHFDIALYAIERGLHVLVTKPAVKTVAHHQQLVDAARRKRVLVMVEFHKRWDPIYTDARERIRRLGDCSLFQSYMSQPKYQLETFRQWAGRSSDISYYLNSHHIDFHAWAMQGLAKPVQVTAAKSTGVATNAKYHCDAGTEDTITLMVQWRNEASGNLGIGLYTASWSASAKAEVHSQQRFHYLGHNGEIRVDQAHRGYETATDDGGYASLNPLYMKYTPDPQGYFAAQRTYGYLSIEAWVEACLLVNAGSATPDDFEGILPTLKSTFETTAILEAGRASLDRGGVPVVVPSQGA